MKQQPLFQMIASAVQAHRSLVDQPDHAWHQKHGERARQLTSQFMPSGSGVDNGTIIDLERSREDRLIFTFGFHHMNDGFYDGWTDHELIVRPSLTNEFDLTVTGRNRNEIKDYLYETHDHALRQIIEQELDGEEVRYFAPALREIAEAYQRSLAQEVNQ